MSSSTASDVTRFPREALERDVTRLLASAGRADDKARCVAQTLVLADMMGHVTHGLALAPGYVASI